MSTSHVQYLFTVLVDKIANIFVLEISMESGWIPHRRKYVQFDPWHFNPKHLSSRFNPAFQKSFGIAAGYCPDIIERNIMLKLHRSSYNKKS